MRVACNMTLIPSALRALPEYLQSSVAVDYVKGQGHAYGMTGQAIAHYQILEKLGEGGME